jgi:hypothetical protein
MRIGKRWIGSSSIRWRKREADHVPDGLTQVIDDKPRTYIRSLGWGLLLESEYLFSATENARARKNKDALPTPCKSGTAHWSLRTRRYANCSPSLPFTDLKGHHSPLSKHPQGH